MHLVVADICNPFNLNLITLDDKSEGIFCVCPTGTINIFFAYHDVEERRE